MSYKIEIITKDDIKTSKWSGGVTNEIYIYPKEASYKDRNFKWRISSATVELDSSTFTHLPNIFRFITTIEGEMDLCHDKGELIHLKPFDIHEFSGEVNTESFGKVRDFNLMLGNGCKGKIISEKIESNVPLKLIMDRTNVAGQEYARFVYSPKEDLTIKVDENIFIVKAGQCFIIHIFNYETMANPNIEFICKKDCNIIEGQVIIKEN